MQDHAIFFGLTCQFRDTVFPMHTDVEAIAVYLKSQCHPKCFARPGTIFIYEKSAIFLIVVKSDLYLLPSLLLAIGKHWCEFRVDI